MSLSAAAIRLLGAKGLTVDEIADVAEANAPTKDSAAERRRAYDRERKRKSAGIPPEDCSAISTGIPPESASRTGAPVVIPFSSSLRSEEVGVGGVEREHAVPHSDDWPEGSAAKHAELLEQAAASPWLDRNKSPDLVTTRGRVAAWKRDGASWEHDVLPVVTGLCANRRGKISSWKFFDDAIARSIADNRAALEIPEASQRRQSTGPPSWADQQAATNAEARRRVLES